MLLLLLLYKFMLEKNHLLSSVIFQCSPPEWTIVKEYRMTGCVWDSLLQPYFVLFYLYSQVLWHLTQQCQDRVDSHSLVFGFGPSSVDRSWILQSWSVLWLQFDLPMAKSPQAVYPSFPDPDGGKPVTFKGLVLNICVGPRLGCNWETVLISGVSWLRCFLNGSQHFG